VISAGVIALLLNLYFGTSAGRPRLQEIEMLFSFIFILPNRLLVVGISNSVLSSLKYPSAMYSS
jgi:hypothetical protein